MNEQGKLLAPVTIALLKLQHEQVVAASLGRMLIGCHRILWLIKRAHKLAKRTLYCPTRNARTSEITKLNPTYLVTSLQKQSM
jgi:hypothetical protein